MVDLKRHKLHTGSHPDRSNGLCAMELVAWMADEPHSDSPACTCPVLAAFVRRLNDRMPDKERQMLKPLLPKLIGTTTNKAGRMRRAYIAADWAVRIVAPAHLRKAGMEEKAKALEACAPIVDKETAALGRDAARKAQAAAAADAAYADAAAYAAAAAAYAAAAAADDADDAYADAADYAADDDAWSLKTSERVTLARSAIRCLERMIEVPDAR